MYISILLLSSLLPTLSFAHPRKTYYLPTTHLSTYFTSTTSLLPPVPPPSLLSRLLRRSLDPVEIATSYIHSLTPECELTLHRDFYTDTDTGVTHVYFSQKFNGLEIENAVANVNVKSDGTVLSYGESLVRDVLKQRRWMGKVRREEEGIGALEALKVVVEKQGYPLQVSEKVETVVENGLDGEDAVISFVGVGGAASDPIAKQVYYATEEGLKLAWRIDTDLDDSYMVTHIDSESQNIIGAIDWVSDATYHVLPFGTNDPSTGPRQTLINPSILFSSPNGWHQTTSFLKYTTTRGNNAIAQENWDAGTDYLLNHRPDGGSSLTFTYSAGGTDGFTNDTDPESYIDASITQAFYLNNIYHDFLSILGFTPAAGNFEAVNTGPGGASGDAVVVNVQDGGDYNNANFRTPPDGSRLTTPRMRMYLWASAAPDNSTQYRDGAFENGIMIHEYTHGLSNRLTGGPKNVECLTSLEAAGMGEGWGDFFATAIRVKPGENRTVDYGMGEWVNGGKGVREYKYSTSLEINPLTWSWVGRDWGWEGPHSVGVVWASMLIEVMWNLEDKWGYQEEVFPEFEEGGRVPKHGRQLAMKLVLEAMKLQPCNPTFFQARDAILDADSVLTGAANKCEIWKGFAKRGLGADAKSTGKGTSLKRIDGYKLPDGVKC